LRSAYGTQTQQLEQGLRDSIAAHRAAQQRLENNRKAKYYAITKRGSV
jgi:hypothetical protein